MAQYRKRSGDTPIHDKLKSDLTKRVSGGGKTESFADMKARKGVAPNLKKSGIPKHLKSSSKAPEGWARHQFEAVERFARSELERAVLAHDARRVRVVADRTQTAALNVGAQIRRLGAGRGVAPSLVALNSAAEITSHEFRVMYNKALLQASGSGERDVRAIVRQLCADGVVKVRDSAGRRHDAAGWAARAVGNALVERRRLDLVRRIQDSGGDLVVVVTESQPCKKCIAWGGRTLSLSGSSTEPSLAYARRHGLYHVNCRCSLRTSNLDRTRR